MVDQQESYALLLRDGISVYDEIIALYLPDKQSHTDWAATTIAEATTKRNAMLERLAHLPLKLSAEDTAPLVQSIVRYIDSHWADYRQLPTADPGKQTTVEQLHAKLAAIRDALGIMHNSLRA